MMRAPRRFLSLLLAMASSVLAFGPQAELMEPTSLWGKNRMLYHQHVKLINDQNHYRLDLQQWKPKGNQMPRLSLMLTEPLKFGNFSRPLDFLTLKINGIDFKDIEPIPHGLKLFQNRQVAGCTMTFDFDGTILDVTWYMTKTSPLLSCSIRLNPQSTAPLKNGTITLSAVPSGTKKKPSGALIYSGAYHREARTARKTYPCANRPQQVSPEDRFLILQDAELQVPQKDVHGPCMVFLGDDSTQKTHLLLKNSWLTTITFTLDDQHPSCRFGLWQGKKPLTNQQAERLARTLSFPPLTHTP